MVLRTYVEPAGLKILLWAKQQHWSYEHTVHLNQPVQTTALDNLTTLVHPVHLKPAGLPLLDFTTTLVHPARLEAASLDSAGLETADREHHFGLHNNTGLQAQPAGLESAGLIHCFGPYNNIGPS